MTRLTVTLSDANNDFVEETVEDGVGYNSKSEVVNAAVRRMRTGGEGAVNNGEEDESTPDEKVEELEDEVLRKDWKITELETRLDEKDTQIEDLRESRAHLVEEAGKALQNIPEVVESLQQHGHVETEESSVTFVPEDEAVEKAKEELRDERVEDTDDETRDELEELVKESRTRRTRRQAGVVTRAKWWLFGQDAVTVEETETEEKADAEVEA